MAMDPKLSAIVEQASVQGLLGEISGGPVQLSAELARLLERGLIGESLPAVLKTSKAAQAFEQAFDLIGGVPRLALWADQNPSKFYTIFSKLIPSTAQISEKKDINVTITWASSSRLSYQQGDLPPANVVENG